MCPLKMQESPEDYLETIYMLSLHSSEVRSIDVARHLGYSKPSVSVAMKRLRENGYVNMDDNNLLTLTDPVWPSPEAFTNVIRLSPVI